MEQDKIEINVIKLENNLNYLIIDTILDENNNKYLFLAEENNSKDIRIRKVIMEDNKEYLVKLDSDEEFEAVMTLFDKKHRKEDNNEK